MAKFELSYENIQKLETAMKQYQGNTEDAINEVLHNEAGTLFETEIKRLMPTSGRRWKGKNPPAKTSKSLRIERGNLFVQVKNTSRYYYLYFPNDGTNTYNHIGGQFFFERGLENKETEVVNRCIEKLSESFERQMR